MSLAEKIVEVAQAIDRIEKDGTFPGQGRWTYATAENVLNRVRGEFLSRRVLVLESVRGWTDRSRTTRQGDETTVTTLDLTYTLLDAESNERIELDWFGRGEDAADRGGGKALTNGIKTFMRQQLMLPWGDDPEADDSDGPAPSGYGGGGTTNLIDAAKGLSDDALKEILEGVGLPIHGTVFGTFARIPAAFAPGVREALTKAKA
jgi:hypothetical protein